MMKKKVIYALSFGVSLLVGTESLYAATGKAEITQAPKKTMGERLSSLKKGVQNRLPGTERYKMRKQAQAKAGTETYRAELQEQMQKGKTAEAITKERAALEKKYSAEKYSNQGKETNPFK